VTQASAALKGDVVGNEKAARVIEEATPRTRAHRRLQPHRRSQCRRAARVKKKGETKFYKYEGASGR